MSLDEIYQHIYDDVENHDVDLSESKIREFYAGKTLFLSGATGYVGKVFIEKILRDCPQLERLYVLVRQKKGVAPEDIMKRYFKNEIFDKLRSIKPNFEKKIVTIAGNLQEDKLGLSIEDRQTLIENIDIIVHTAANTRFDEKLSIALKTNVLGTKHMLDLAMDCQKICTFVYVSTGYSHCYRKNIEEVFYDSPCDLEMVNHLIYRDEANEDGLRNEALKKVLQGKWPNVYTFSKAIAEGLVRHYGDRAHFAIGVYRPTIIIAALKEPMPGWLGNNHGPTLLFAGVGLGIIHVFYHDRNQVEDYVPVDMSVNCLVAIVYELAQQWQMDRKPVVYNYGSSVLNPVSMVELFNWMLSEGAKLGSTQMLWYPFVFFCRSLWQFWILHILVHFIPALLVDFALLCLLKKPRALRLFFQVTRNLDVINYFSNGNWRIRADKSMELYDRLNEADRAIFEFDIRKLDWQTMMLIYMRGARIHTLNEPLKNKVKAQRRFHRLKILHYTVSSVLFVSIAYFVTKFLFDLIF